MPENETIDYTPIEIEKDSSLAPLQIVKHGSLFLLTLLTSTIAGLLWQNELDLSHFYKGLPYSLSLLFILSCHEFGHYFAARIHKVKVTLPYYIPIPPLPSFINFGTLGAVIRTKQRIPSRKALFDIGIAGPIAGFIASLIVLVYGFTHLPGTDFLLGIHPDYDFSTDAISQQPAAVLTFGSTLLYDFMASIFAPAGDYLPPMTEMYHYPFLVTGWFGLLVTALNLLPTGQLDGGHISFAMFGTYHKIVARITVAVLIFLGGMGVFPAILDIVGFTEMAIILMESIPGYESLFWPGWLFWAVLILFVVKVDHPPVEDNEILDPRRRLIGWSAWLMFILCFSPAPLYIG
jgi:membrane-associated protease RseP (regulator of RpoE activity)